MKQRIVYIDHIKVFLTFMVVAHHAAQAYGPTGGVWVINDSLRASWLGQFFFINASFMMGLYFFISGYFLVFSIGRKSVGSFLGDRFKRLGIPLAFFTLLVFLPLNYILSGSSDNIIPFFMNTYFHKAPIATGHLWFVASLLVYSLLYIFIFHKAINGLAKRAGAMTFGKILFFLIVLSVLTAIVRLYYPIDKWTTWIIPVEPAHLPQYFLLFLAGALFNQANWMSQLQTRHGIFFIFLALAFYLLKDHWPEAIQGSWLKESMTESVMCIGISLGLLIFFKDYCNNSHRFLQQLSANAYGIYLVHIFVVILLQYVLLPLNWDPTFKFLLVAFTGFLLSFGLSALIRQIKVVGSLI